MPGTGLSEKAGEQGKITDTAKEFVIVALPSASPASGFRLRVCVWLGVA